MKAKLHFLLLLVVMTSIVVAACAPATTQPSTQAPAQLVPVRLRLDWIPGPEHSPFYVAKDRGDYEACGLDVTIDPGSGSSDSAKLLGSGEIQFGIVDAAQVVNARSEEIPIVSVAVIYQNTPISIAWLADELTLKTPADLAGLTIGSNPASTHDILREAFLESQGLTGKVDIIPIGFTGVEPLLMGVVDTQMGFVMDWNLVEDAGHKADFFLVKDYGVQLYSLTISTNEEYLTEHPDNVRCFVQASLKAYDYMISNPIESMDIARKYVPELDPSALGMQKLELTFPLIVDATTEDKGIGWQEEVKWASTQQILVDGGAVTDPVDPKALFSMLALEE